MTVYTTSSADRPEPLKASRWPGLFRIQRPRRFGFFVAVLVFLAVLGLLLAFVLRGAGEDDAAAPSALRAERRRRRRRRDGP